MPSNWSSTCRPRGRAISNVVRYHHGTANGLSESIGRCTKFCPILYDMPGRSRRFMLKNGSRYTPVSTSAPTTVDGTVTLYQWRARYDGDEIAAPSTPTFAEDCNVQSSCSMRRCWAPAAAEMVRNKRRGRIVILASEASRGSTCFSYGVWKADPL